MYEDCKISEWFDKSVGRYRVRVTFPDGSKKYMLRSRFNYQYFWDIELDSTQCVDHVDENPLNDDIKNLQLLTRKENASKEAAHFKLPLHVFNCAACGKETSRKPNAWKIRNQRHFYCSVPCKQRGFL